MALHKEQVSVWLEEYQQELARDKLRKGTWNYISEGVCASQILPSCKQFLHHTVSLAWIISPSLPLKFWFKRGFAS